MKLEKYLKSSLGFHLAKTWLEFDLKLQNQACSTLLEGGGTTSEFLDLLLVSSFNFPPHLESCQVAKSSDTFKWLWSWKEASGVMKVIKKNRWENIGVRSQGWMIRGNHICGMDLNWPILLPSHYTVWDPGFRSYNISLSFCLLLQLG